MNDTTQGMGHRQIKSADEYDVHTGWRKWYLWTQRPGATASVKRRTRRRERHEAKRQIARGGYRPEPSGRMGDPVPPPGSAGVTKAN